MEKKEFDNLNQTKAENKRLKEQYHKLMTQSKHSTIQDMMHLQVKPRKVNPLNQNLDT